MLETYIEKLKDLNNQKSPEDIIMAIFLGINETTIPKDHGAIQNAIYNLKKVPEYEALLKDFTFNTSGITPYSKLLEQVLTRIETFCIFGTVNPRYDRYTVNKVFLNKAFNKYSDEERALIIEMSKGFKELIH